MNQSSTLLSDLRHDIRDYVYQQQRGKKGNATTVELIVMACVMSDRPLSIPDVCRWVNRYTMGCDENVNPSAWLHSVGPELKDWRVPVREVRENGTRCWMSPTTNADIFLRRRLFRRTTVAPKKPFRLMDLPAEIRVSIFEFALLLPRSGVWHDLQKRRTTKAWTAEREGGMTPYSPDEWRLHRDSPRDDPKWLFQVNLQAHLSLFRVSKLVYKEALPCYYSQNVFFLPNDEAASDFFRRLPDARLRHVGHVVWRCEHYGPPSDVMIQKLAALPRLRTLIVHMPSQQWGLYDIQAGVPLSVVSQMSSITGLEDVQFFGAISEQEEILRSKMVGQKKVSRRALEKEGVLMLLGVLPR